MKPVEVCPAGIAAAPVDAVWALLADPGRYTEWADVTEVVSAEPPGHVTAGQRIVMHTRAFGMTFSVAFDIKAVDANAHTLELDVALPFGLVNRERIVCQPADGGTLIRFY